MNRTTTNRTTTTHHNIRFPLSPSFAGNNGTQPMSVHFSPRRKVAYVPTTLVADMSLLFYTDDEIERFRQDALREICKSKLSTSPMRSKRKSTEASSSLQSNSMLPVVAATTPSKSLSRRNLIVEENLSSTKQSSFRRQNSSKSMSLSPVRRQRAHTRITPLSPVSFTMASDNDSQPNRCHSQRSTRSTMRLSRAGSERVLHQRQQRHRERSPQSPDTRSTTTRQCLLSTTRRRARSERNLSSKRLSPPPPTFRRVARTAPASGSKPKRFEDLISIYTKTN